MRETGKPPVRIAALAISVENLHARSVVAAAACDPTITLKRNRDGRLRSRTLRQPLATPLAALAKSNGQWVVEAQEPRLYSIANAGCDCFDETGKPSDDPACGCGRSGNAHHVGYLPHDLVHDRPAELVVLVEPIGVQEGGEDIGILDTEIHSPCADTRVDMGGIAAQVDTPSSEDLDMKQSLRTYRPVLL